MAKPPAKKLVITGKATPLNAAQGATITFVVQFKDQSGKPVVPSSAAASFMYGASGTATQATIKLVNKTNDWTGTWTASADSGTIPWSVVSSLSSPTKVGQFQIVSAPVTTAVALTDKKSTVLTGGAVLTA